MLRFIARAALSSVFVYAGQAAAREPGGRGKAVQKLAKQVGISLDDKKAGTVVKLNGGVMTVFGVTLALGIFPKLSALALIGSLVPTTVAGHAFWEETDPDARQMQATQFAKNAGIIGGLMLVILGGGKAADGSK